MSSPCQLCPWSFTCCISHNPHMTMKRPPAAFSFCRWRIDHKELWGTLSKLHGCEQLGFESKLLAPEMPTCCHRGALWPVSPLSPQASASSRSRDWAQPLRVGSAGPASFRLLWSRHSTICTFPHLTSEKSSPWRAGADPGAVGGLVYSSWKPSTVHWASTSDKVTMIDWYNDKSPSLITPEHRQHINTF
jgi:hypothetical protein